MSSPLLDASGVSSSPSLGNLTPRQRLEKVLDQLPVAGSAAAQSESAQPSLIASDQLVAPVQRINEVLKNYGVEFHLSDPTDPGSRMVTEVIDTDTGKVIRQIPSEEVLRFAQNLDKLRGLLFQGTA